MPETLTPESLPGFNARWDDFHDAVIQTIHLDRVEKQPGLVATLVLDAQDGSDDWKWVRVALTMHGVTDFCLTEGPGYYLVIFQLQVTFDDETAQLAQDEEAWFIRGQTMTWAVSPLP